MKFESSVRPSRCSSLAFFFQCMNKLGITEPSYQSVEACHKSAEGDQLLADLGRKTMALNPQLYFVPWITFDGVSLRSSTFIRINRISLPSYQD